MKRLFFPLMAIAFTCSAFAHYGKWAISLQFICYAIALIFSAGLLGKATESVAQYTGQRLGGLINATFGNAAELIMCISLIKQGLYGVVKASLTGAIIGNLLFVLGASAFIGGLKYKEQKFNIHLAGQSASLMQLSVIALALPALFVKMGKIPSQLVFPISEMVGGFLIMAYMGWIVYSMKTHRDLLEEAEQGKRAQWSKKNSILLLSLATFMVVSLSEWLVLTLKEFSLKFGFSELFLGAFFIAIIGNTAEHFTAVLMALKNKMGTVIEITVGSSLQIALFVAPILIFVSQLLGKQMDFIFSTIELVAIAVAMLISTSISRDGTTTWFEGGLLLIVYFILGLCFYFV